MDYGICQAVGGQNGRSHDVAAADGRFGVHRESGNSSRYPLFRNYDRHLRSGRAEDFRAVASWKGKVVAGFTSQRTASGSDAETFASGVKEYWAAAHSGVRGWEVFREDEVRIICQ